MHIFPFYHIFHSSLENSLWGLHRSSSKIAHNMSCKETHSAMCVPHSIIHPSIGLHVTRPRFQSHRHASQKIHLPTATASVIPTVEGNHQVIIDTSHWHLPEQHQAMEKSQTIAPWSEFSYPLVKSIDTVLTSVPIKVHGRRHLLLGL
jgi:hypothetical protein